jgi:hypothetical protein
MGNNSSTQKQDDSFEAAKKRAIENYNYRVQNYNYLKHGPIEYYMIQVAAEYELECIPKHLRSGRGF